MFHTLLPVSLPLCDSFTLRSRLIHGANWYRRALTADRRDWSKPSRRRICGRQSGTVTQFSPSTSVSHVSIPNPGFIFIFHPYTTEDTKSYQLRASLNRTILSLSHTHLLTLSFTCYYLFLKCLDSFSFPHLSFLLLGLLIINTPFLSSSIHFFVRAPEQVPATYHSQKLDFSN